MIYDIISSRLGDIVVSTDGSAITNFRFAGQRYFLTIPEDWVRSSNHPLLQRARKQTDEYFAGKRKSFDLPLSLAGTNFQKAVWKSLAQVAFGETISYGDIAKKIGRPKAFRAVGTAIGQNPICIILPCHRVIGTNGKLTGYAGGFERKEGLLRLEGYQ